MSGHKDFVRSKNQAWSQPLAWGNNVNGALGTPYDLTGYTATLKIWTTRGDDDTLVVDITDSDPQLTINAGVAQNPNIEIGLTEATLGAIANFTGGWYELELTPAAGAGKIILRGGFSLTE